MQNKQVYSTLCFKKVNKQTLKLKSCLQISGEIPEGNLKIPQ